MLELHCYTVFPVTIRRTEAPLPYLGLVRSRSIQGLGFSPVNEAELVLCQLGDGTRPSSLLALLEHLAVMDHSCHSGVGGVK